MICRLSQVARHLCHPIPTALHRSAPSIAPSRMTSQAAINNATGKTIHTAGCIIIGDEVLGGKVSWEANQHEHIRMSAGNTPTNTTAPADSRHKLYVHVPVLLLPRHGP